MKVIGRDNQVKNGFLHFPAFLQALLGELTDEAIAKAIPDEKIKKIKRVIITGNGDSYAACLATKEFNSRMFHNLEYQALRCIDVSRHHVFPTQDPEATLVIVISVSGGGARVTEAMRRAALKGCTTLAVTGNPDSPMAKEAEHILTIRIPAAEAFSPAYQARTYVAALCTTLLFGMHAGKLFGSITEEAAELMRREILEYSRAVCCEEVLGRIDQQMYELAQTWQTYIGFDFVGGGTDFATAYFGTAKFFELCGSLNCLNDSEDWCHIDYFQTDRDKIGTAVAAFGNCASFSRTVETVGSMLKSGRNVLVVSDRSREAFPEGAVVCRLPATLHDSINPIMNFIPFFMLGNYIAINRNYEYFGGMGADNPLFSQEGGINTIKTSRIEYIK
jgi:glucosamine 6-phosphate synthetase-like amidotransferase/phosphosugar isomerase protein